MKNNFVMVTFPGGEHSIMRMGVFREIFDKEIEDAVIVDYSIWNMNYMRQAKTILSHMRDDCSNFVIFVPGARLLKYVPTKTILELMKSTKSPDVVMCYLLDGIERMAFNHRVSIQECLNRLKNFDAVFTYDVYESAQYGFVYEPLPLKKFYETEQKNEIETKLFFCGRSKGRMQMLREIAMACEDRNIAYEFLILSDKETMGMQDEGGIHFIQYLKYDLLVKKISEVSCILSLVADKNHMMPASYNEAIMYNKKLITNCPFLEDNLYYDKRFMKSFDAVENIDFEWMCNGERVDYRYTGQFSAKVFLEHISSEYQRGLLKRCGQLNHKLRKMGASTYKLGIHYAKKGWIEDIENAAMIRLPYQVEAIRLYNLPDDVSVTLKVMSKNNGLSEGVDEAHYVECGTVGKSDPILSFVISLKSDSSYLLYYRAFVSNVGWTRFFADGECCGISDPASDLVIEGVQIMLINEKYYTIDENMLGGMKRDMACIN